MEILFGARLVNEAKTNFLMNGTIGNLRTTSRFGKILQFRLKSPRQVESEALASLSIGNGM